jgi:Flp pilus assembly protein TadB
MNVHTDYKTGSNDVIVPDEIIDGHGRTQRLYTTPTRSDRQLRFIDRVIVVLMAIAIVVVVSIVAVGAAVIAAVLIVIGLVARVWLSLSHRARTQRSR